MLEAVCIKPNASVVSDKGLQNQESQVVPINGITSCHLSGVVFDVSVTFYGHR